ncbi:hypothetical protein PM082_011198 [Marasmius tenuissimus]|nr:hypothetical protein PM082_011198 [Marasmius tenuissimus]
MPPPPPPTLPPHSPSIQTPQSSHTSQQRLLSESFVPSDRTIHPYLPPTPPIHPPIQSPRSASLIHPPLQLQSPYSRTSLPQPFAEPLFRQPYQPHPSPSPRPFLAHGDQSQNPQAWSQELPPPHRRDLLHRTPPIQPPRHWEMQQAGFIQQRRHPSARRTPFFVPNDRVDHRLSGADGGVLYSPHSDEIQPWMQQQQYHPQRPSGLRNPY